MLMKLLPKKRFPRWPRLTANKLGRPAVILALLTAPGVAHAYIGPGVGAGAIGVVLGVIGAVFLAIFAVIYYPIKRALKKRRKSKAADSKTTNPEL